MYGKMPNFPEKSRRVPIPPTDLWVPVVRKPKEEKKVAEASAGSQYPKVRRTQKGRMLRKRASARLMSEDIVKE